MSRRALTVGGGVLATGVGYYLYTAGGDPKVAQKEVEHDAARVSNKLQSGLPGSGKEAKKQGEVWAAEAGSKLDQTVADAKAKGREADAKLSQEWNKAGAEFDKLKAQGGQKFEETRREVNKDIDQFDRKVEKKTSEAKSGISSWFGGK